jgi:beta-glucosidase
MHHFSSPKWLISQGGWENPATADLFASYCERATGKLGSSLEYVCTIKEANMGLQIAAMAKSMTGGAQAGLSTDRSIMMQAMIKAGEAFGCDPRNVHTFWGVRSPEGDRIIMNAHEKARDAIKGVLPRLKVGVTLSLHDIQALLGGEKNAAKEWDEEFSHYLPYIKDDDFLGAQCYTRMLIDANGKAKQPEEAPQTQMGYENYPQAMFGLIAVDRKTQARFPKESLTYLGSLVEK